MDGLVGRTIKGYEFIECIGTGGMGAVYRAHRPHLKTQVAIKVILPQYANQPDFILRFEHEAELVSRLEHPYIVPLYDYWREPDGAYLVMRFLRGGSLHDWLKQGALEPVVAFRVLEQIAAALMFAHRRKVIHRDLKPGNILLDEDRNAYLTDFGIAKVITGKTTSESSGQISGSLEYVAPEQLKSQRVTPQSDIYSLGIVLYEMLTGEHAFAGSTPSEVVYKHLETPLPDVHRQCSGVPEAVSDVVHKATSKNSNQRFADTQQLVLVFGLAVGCSIAFGGSLKNGFRIGLAVGLASSLGFGLAFGFTFGPISKSGEAVVQHVVLHEILQRAGCVPANYAQFLDLAVARVLMRRIGGGYTFIHRYLLEYFADLEA